MFYREEAQRGKGYKCRGGIMAEEAVSLFKCFYEQGNPNGNHFHIYLQLGSLMKHILKDFVLVIAPKPHRPVVQRERTWGEHVTKIGCHRTDWILLNRTKAQFSILRYGEVGVDFINDDPTLWALSTLRNLIKIFQLLILYFLSFFLGKICVFLYT